MEVKVTVLHDRFAVLQPSPELGLVLPLRSNDPNKPSDLAVSVSPPVKYGRGPFHQHGWLRSRHCGALYVVENLAVCTLLLSQGRLGPVPGRSTQPATKSFAVSLTPSQPASHI